MVYLVILVLFFVFRKELRSLVNVISDAINSLNVAVAPAALEARFDSHSELLKLANRQGISVPNDISTDDLIALLRK